MTAQLSNRLLGYLRRFVRPSADAVTDQELLGRFIATRDEQAFGALVERHGGLVRGVCLRVLGNDTDADDAFQATFLVLARKARSVRRRWAVRSWLYGVAQRVAHKARVSAAK